MNGLQRGADLGLARYDAMCHAIADCHQVDEVKDMRDQARAIEVYAHQARNLDAERKAAEIRIRAERKVGELLTAGQASGQLATAKNGRPSEKASDTPRLSDSRRPRTLSELGISYDQSSQWQQLAAVPQEHFERAITAEGPPPTTEGIIHSHRPRPNPQPQIDLDALWFWGRLREFEEREFFAKDGGALIKLMTHTMRDDCARLLPKVISWLSRAQEKEKGNGSNDGTTH